MRNVFCVCIICVSISSDCSAMLKWMKSFLSTVSTCEGTKIGEVVCENTGLDPSSQRAEDLFISSVYEWSSLDKEHRKKDDSLKEIRQKKQECITAADKNKSEIAGQLLKDRVDFYMRAVEALRRKEAKEAPLLDDDSTLSAFSRIYNGHLGAIELENNELWPF